MAVKGAPFASYPDGQTVFGLGGDRTLQPLPIPDAYEFFVAAAASAAIGASGAAGDFLEAIIVMPASTSPGAITIKDGSAGSAITIFPGGANSVADLKPFTVRLGLRATGAGGWQLATGAAVAAIATGIFT
jgi:hypothetical protein